MGLLLAELLWKPDTDVQAARKLPGWGEFHRACGRLGFYFDHPERQGGRRGDFHVLCFTVLNYRPMKLSDGRGATVLDALKSAHDRSGRATPETTAALERLIAGPSAAEADIFEDLLG